MEHFRCKELVKCISLVTVGGALLLGGSAVFAGVANGNANGGGNGNANGASYSFSGSCAALGADRSTEFHGNPNRYDLGLAMAGNQWVVFNKVMSRFNERRIATGSLGADQDDDLNHAGNGGVSHASLNADRNNYFIELIPPGKERAQILSGCMTLGNEKDTNFLPLSIQVDFDIFASTNYTEMQTLAAKGFVSEALAYTKNKLTIMTSDAVKASLEGTTALDTYYNTVMFMLNPANKVANVDHKDEGVHAGINKMYKFMDKYIRENGSVAQVTALNAALAAVEFPQANSPSLTRANDIAGHIHATDHVLSTNSDCNYGNGTLRFCEFAVLNKANTHETRVHHVEIPGGILGKDGFEPVVAGPVWVSELQFAQDAGDVVAGVNIPTTPLANGADKVNGDVVYSIALLATMKNTNKVLAEQFMEFIREEGNGVLGDGIGDAQDEYVAGGFSVMTAGDLAGHQIYDCDGDGVADQLNGSLAVPQTCP